MKIIQITFLGCLIFLVLSGCQTVQQSPDLKHPAEGVLKPETNPHDIRLSGAVRPVEYHLAFEVMPRLERFTGKTEIEIQVSDNVREIRLHGMGLEVSKVSVLFKKRVISATFSQTDKYGAALIALPESIGPGKAIVSIDYSAPFGKPPEALFKVTAGVDNYAFTQFEPVYARRAFPCFDEPGFKTPFTFEIVVGEQDKAFFNTPETSEELLGYGKKLIKFARTRPLPTYLVAFAVGALDVLSAGDVPVNKIRAKPLPLRGIAARNRTVKLQYALSTAAKVIPVMEEYFGIAFPYEKLDLVAVPDMGSAMENPGLITLAESLLFPEEKLAPFENRRMAANVVTHEIAHMWLGDMVTMKWWDDLWLNEASATWITPKILDVVFPEFGEPLNRLKNATWTMTDDSQPNARQIRQPITCNEDITTAFDQITYSKGGTVISMFERWVGIELFRKGLHDYLVAHFDGNATVDDLLKSVSGAYGREITAPFLTFLDQPGLPFIEIKPVCKNGDMELALHQSRFLSLGVKGDRNKCWQIPLCVRSGVDSGGPVACKLFDAVDGTMTLKGVPCGTPVHPNADGAGYYRWSLPGDYLRALSVVGSRRNVRERLVLADVIKAGVYSGRIPAKDALSALEPLFEDESPDVLEVATTILTISKETLTPAEKKWVTVYLQKMFKPIIEKIGIAPIKDNEDWRVAERREIVFRLMLDVAEDPEIRKRLSDLGCEYLGFGSDGQIHPDKVRPEMVNLALSAAVREKGKPIFDYLVERLGKEENPLERGRYIFALASTTDPKLGIAACALSIDPRLKYEETLWPLYLQSNQSQTQDAAWNWIKTNFDPLLKRVTGLMVDRIPLMASSLCSQEAAKDVEAFFRKQMPRLGDSERALAQALDWINRCDAIKSAQCESIREFFLEKSGGQ